MCCSNLSTSRRPHVCITCLWLLDHAGLNSISLFNSQFHKGLASLGDHLTHRRTRWTEYLAAQRGGPYGVLSLEVAWTTESWTSADADGRKP